MSKDKLLMVDTTEKPSMFWGYATVITGICVHLFCGNMYLWGNVSGYVVSYFHFEGDSNATLSVAVIVLPLSFTV